MYNFEIENLMKNNKEISKNTNFKIYSPENIPQKEIKGKKSIAFIVNLCTIDSGGCHWTAVYQSFKSEGRQKGSLEYYDPSGFPTYKLVPEIKQFIEKNKGNKKLIFNKIANQSENSVMCGQFCMSFLVCRCKGISFKKFLNFFVKKNLSENDNILKRMFSKIFKKK